MPPSFCIFLAVVPLVALIILTPVDSTTAAAGGVSYPIADYSVDCQYREDREASPPSFTSVSHYNMSCTQGPSCRFFRDVLLVIKLNPVRLLWLDILLNFYGTGFPNIVFFSSLRKGDTSSGKYLTIGSRDVKVHLIDDNYGFCDHETVAAAMAMWPGQYSGYLFLSDDVLLEFWKLLYFDLKGSWRVSFQLAGTKKSSTVTIPQAVTNAIRAIHADPRIDPSMAGRVREESPPFSFINGVFYVPSSASQQFIVLSDILKRSHCPNAFGTQMILSYVDEGFTKQIIPGKYAGRRSLQPVVLLRDATLTWYWPVRATSETMARMMIVVHETDALGVQDHFSATTLFDKYCMNCAKYPQLLASRRGPYHNCFASAPDYCSPDPLAAMHGGAGGELRRGKRIVDTVDPALGGRLFVPPDRVFVKSPLERDSDVVTGKEEVVFDSLYGLRNVTKCTARILARFPHCCWMWQ